MSSWRQFMNCRKIIMKKSENLEGKVKITGAKNSTLAILPAIVLVGEVCRLENVPDISDVSLMCKILSHLGVEIKMIAPGKIEVDSRNVSNICADFDEIRYMRASYYLLGALLGRFGNTSVSMPGGCDLGLRPMDQHIKGFSALGAKCEISGGITHVSSNKLKGGRVYFDVVSVGATINTIIASVKADGVTIIENAAKEPHVVDLANFLNSCGADIRGAGTDVIKIYGVKKLHGTTYQIIPDQIEAGTYMVAAFASKGDVLIENVITKHLESITAKLIEIGASVTLNDDSIRVTYNGKFNKCNVNTMPYPGFPTDMQPQIVTLLTRCNGTSIVSEGVWNSRFRYISELRRLGAQISVDGRLAIIEGGTELVGNNVKAIDLRAGAALVIAGLFSEGMTSIENIHHIERGYENIVGKLSNIGANISVIEEEKDISCTQLCKTS